MVILLGPDDADGNAHTGVNLHPVPTSADRAGTARARVRVRVGQGAPAAVCRGGGACSARPNRRRQIPKAAGYWMVPRGVARDGSRDRAIMASSGTSNGARTPNPEAGVNPNLG